MLLECSAHRRIGGIVGCDIGKGDAAQLGTKAGTQRHDVHAAFLPIVFQNLRQSRATGNAQDRRLRPYQKPCARGD